MNEDNRLERRLEQFYEQVPPPPQGLKAGRERFLAQAARLPKERPFAGARVQAKPRRRKMKLALAYKIVAAVLAVVMGTAALGGGVAYAASDSLPGEPLYPVKLAFEDVRLAFSAGPAARAQLGMAFAAERVREMQQLAQQGEFVPGTVPARMAQHMEQTMAQVAKAKPEDVPALLEQVMTQTRAQEQFLEQVQAKGHSIEARIYAEDPDHGFLPSIGTVENLDLPGGARVRVDSSLFKGMEVSLFYDPMLAKLVVTESDRDEAIKRLKRSLGEFHVSGVKTNIPFLLAIIETEAFREGRYHTGFVEQNLEEILKKGGPQRLEDVAMVAATISHILRRNESKYYQRKNTPSSGWNLSFRPGC